jgi:hypothetical protein
MLLKGGWIHSLAVVALISFCLYFALYEVDWIPCHYHAIYDKCLDLSLSGKECLVAAAHYKENPMAKIPCLLFEIILILFTVAYLLLFYPFVLLLRYMKKPGQRL